MQWSKRCGFACHARAQRSHQLSDVRKRSNSASRGIHHNTFAVLLFEINELSKFCGAGGEIEPPTRVFSINLSLRADPIVPAIASVPTAGLVNAFCPFKLLKNTLHARHLTTFSTFANASTARKLERAHSNQAAIGSKKNPTTDSNKRLIGAIFGQ